MKWITALNLETWAKTIEARQTFPALIADLIRATAAHIDAFRFPSGDKAQVRGFDGNLIADEAAPFVPGGRSIWEFGVNEGAAQKAGDDFEKRTKEMAEADRHATTFVFVSPWTWNNPKAKRDDWVSEKCKLGMWKDVRYLDGSQLEDWLEMCPAVAAQYARYHLALIPPTGVRSTDEYWAEYSSRFHPKLMEEVLLCEREDQAKALVQWFRTETSGTISFAADSPEEVIAFAVAAIRKAEAETRAYVEARAIVVDTQESAQQLGERNGRIFLPRAQGSRSAGWLAQRGPTLVAMGGNQPLRSQVLPRPTRSSLAKAIAMMGLTEERANVLARECGRSVTILSRRIPAGGMDPPEWHAHGPVLLPALLAGAWTTGSAYDKQVLAELAGRKYVEWEAELRPLARLCDPPIDHIDDVWQVRAPVDAFCWLSGHLGEDELQRLRNAAIKVLSHAEDPPSATDVFLPGRPQQDGPSGWLRSGLANTLLMVATLHQEARLSVPRNTPQAFVDEIIRSLPAYAGDPRRLTDLGADLRLLAEASPDPFLAALERALEREGAQMKMVLTEADGVLAPHSAHPNLLWALEALAWEPTLLCRVSQVLARLAEIDPGGRLSNRPINSLRAIFLSWAPNTHADLPTRLAALDDVIRAVPIVGWKLITELLPRHSDVSSESAKPRYRTPSVEPDVLTYGIVWESQRLIVSRVLELAGCDPARLCVVIEHMDVFQPQLFQRALESVEGYLVESRGDEHYLVWSALSGQLHRHRAYSNTNWAMKEDQLRAIEEVVNRRAPADLLARVRWLFDDWSPDVRGDLEKKWESVEQERRRVLAEILRERGLDGILKLAERVKIPRLIGLALPGLLPDVEAVATALVQATGQHGDGQDGFLTSLSGAASRRFERAWTAKLKTLATANAWAPSLTVCALLGLPDRQDTWDIVARFGSAVEQTYWREKQAFPLVGPPQDLDYAVQKYSEVARASAALEVASERLEDLSVERILCLLDDLAREVSARGQVGGMVAYHLERVFEHLHHRPGVVPAAVTQREYIFLPILERTQSTLWLHRAMEEQPEFYVSVVKDVFRADDEDARGVGETEVIRARLGYILLASFKTVPGAGEGVINSDRLRSWICDVRRIAAETKRGEIVDEYIGHLLAHAPSDRDDRMWPARGVREVLEQLRADGVERGIAIERFNMRGAYSKQMYEGGAQERALAEQYRDWATQISGFPRTSRMLRTIASDWDRLATREDIRAEKDKLRHG